MSRAAAPFPLILTAALVVTWTFAAAPRSASAAPPDLSGQWAVVVEVAGQNRDYLLELVHQGEKLEGALVSPRTKNRYPIRTGSFKDGVIKLQIPRELAGSDTVLKVSGKLVGEKLEGTVEVEGLDVGAGKVSGTRKEGPPAKKLSLEGRWKTRAQVGERVFEADLEVTARDGKLSAVSRSERGSRDFTSVKAEGGKVTLGFTLPIDGQEREFVIRADFEGTDRLKGTWSSADGSSSGDWTAEREKPAPVTPANAPRGRYAGLVRLPEGKTKVFDLQLSVVGEKLTGHLLFDEKKVEIRGGAFKEGKLEFKVEIREEAGPREAKLTGAVGDKGSLKGQWSSGDNSGEWSAKPAADL